MIRASEQSSGQANADRLDIADAVARVHDRIDRACEAAQRDPAGVHLVVVTKTVPAERVALALAAGELILGENRSGEAVVKARELGLPPPGQGRPELHFIGHLQRNKVRDVVRVATCLHSLDSAALADTLERRLAEAGRTLDVMVQVNVSGEASKSGCSPQEVHDLAAYVGALPHLRLVGLMTIGLHSRDLADVRRGFRLLRELRDEVASSSLPGTATAWELSMGMSGDLEAAIAEGATYVRVGSAIFGAR